MSKTAANRPPEGWALQPAAADYVVDILDPLADTYASERLTKDGQTFVSGSWNGGDGLEIIIEQDGHEISLPSPWAARKLSELLWQIAAEAES